MREKNESALSEEGGKPGLERKNMKMTLSRTESNPVEIRNASRHFVYYCPKLDLWAVGRTREEAETTLKEEILLLLTKCRDYLDSPEALNGNAYATVEIRPS
jgi:hypothetical protein